MLAVGCLNLLLGSLTAVKLKRMRRALAGPGPMLEAYRRALAAGGHSADGLAAGPCAALFASEFGVRFSRWEMQAVLLEIDGRRCGLVDEHALLRWYHGHIGRTLKQIAKAPPDPDACRTYAQWALRCPAAAHDLSVWASALMALLAPAAASAALVSLIHPNVLQLVLSVYLLVVACVLFVVEARVARTRRYALHILRYASALLHPTARGALYLLSALALLSQDLPYIWPLGYAVEVLGIVTLGAGVSVSAKLRAFRAHFTATRSCSAEAAVVTSFGAVAQGGRPVGEWGLRMIAQAAGVPLRYSFERVALLNTLDLDRDGKLSELDLLYWLTDREDHNDDARGMANAPIDEPDAPSSDEDPDEPDDGRGYGSALEAFGGSKDAPTRPAAEPMTLERALDEIEPGRFGARDGGAPAAQLATPAASRGGGGAPTPWQEIDGARTPMSSLTSDRV